jgi:hypothetical protein
MSQPSDEKNRLPPRWATNLYRFLAVGRYAVIWLPELVILYDLIVEEEGESKAQDWLMKELALSISPSLSLRLFRLYRAAHLAWTTYIKIADN